MPSPEVRALIIGALLAATPAVSAICSVLVGAASVASAVAVALPATVSGVILWMRNPPRARPDGTIEVADDGKGGA